MDHLRLSSALERVMDVVKKANKYIDEVSPWDLSKNGDPRLGTTLNYLCESLRITASVLRPFLVHTPALIWSALGMVQPVDECSWDSAGNWGEVTAGQMTRRGKPLFPASRMKRLMGTARQDASAKGKATKEVSAVTEVKDDKPKAVEPSRENAEITIDQFKQLDLRVAEVVAAEKVEGADKLLKLRLNLGGEERQIVAGIAQYYSRMSSWVSR